MRISDWSSDVCSSDLLVILGIAFFIVGGVIVFLLTDDDDGDSASDQARPVSVVVATNEVAAGALADELIEQGGLRVVENEVGEMVRSEERRVGKESVNTCSSRWSQYH